MTPSGVDSSALCSTGSGDNEALNHLMTKAKRHHPIKQCALPLIWATAREPFLRRRTIKSASEPASGNPGPFTFHLGSLLFGGYSGGRLKMLVISLRRLWEPAFKFEHLQLFLCPSGLKRTRKAPPAPINRSLLWDLQINYIFLPKFTHPHPISQRLSYLFSTSSSSSSAAASSCSSGKRRWMGGQVEKRRGPGVTKKRSDFSFSCLYAASAMWSLKVLKTWEAPEGSEQSH